jgi:tight adherence protein C
MPLPVFLAASAVVASLPLLVWAVAAERAPRRAALRNLRRADPLVDLRRIVLDRSANERAVKPFVRALASIASRLTPRQRIELIRHRLDLAGHPRTWSLERVLAARVTFGAAGLLAGILVFGDLDGSAAPLVGASVLLGYRLPDVLLLSRARRRQEEIARALPDTIDQITVCVEAGLGFDAALKRVVETGSGPLNDELHRTLREMRVGSSRSRALAALAERTDAVELHRFVAAMQQAEGYGLPITDMLRGHAHELRTRRRQKAEERALKLPVKLVFPLLFCVLPSLFVVTLGPAAIQMLRFMGAGGGP